MLKQLLTSGLSQKWSRRFPLLGGSVASPVEVHKQAQQRGIEYGVEDPCPEARALVLSPLRPQVRHEEGY